MAKAKVYLETTIVSYLVASPTRDVIQAAHPPITRQWWEHRERFDLTCLEPSSLKRGGATRMLRHADWGLFAAFRDWRSA